MTIRVLDLETTGFDPAIDEICEIASIDIVGENGRLVMANPREHKINPCRPIPPEASAVHHILDEDVAGAPVLAEKIGLYGDAKAYVAHNSAFEQGFLTKHIGAKTWLCTFRIAKRLWPNAPAHANQVLRYWLGIKTPFGVPREKIDPHRALSDCYVTGEIFIRQFAAMMKEHGDKAVVWRMMQEWSLAPPLDYVIRYGNKHKGERYDQVAAEDPSFLEWVRDKSELDADTKWNADHWLRQRHEAPTPAPAPAPPPAPSLTQQQLI